MKRKLIFLISILLLCSSKILLQNYPRVTLISAHERTIKSNIVDGMEYVLNIALPEGYNDTTLTYPVVYMLDAYDLFGLQLQTYQQLAYFEDVPKLILVGINYNLGNEEYYKNLTEYEYLRSRDYTPTALEKEEIIKKYGINYACYIKESGGSDKFLRFFNEEIIPFIESEYRTDPNDRCILGFSHGGLFTTYPLFYSPETFQKIFIGSPALWWDDDVVFTYCDPSKYKPLANPVKVYLSIGELEGKGIKASYDKLKEFIDEKENTRIELTTETLPNERHLIGIGMAFSRAFRRLCGDK